MSKAKRQNETDSTEYAHITDPSKTVLIRRQKEQYRITVVNPLTGEQSFQKTTSWLKIDGIGIAGEKMELSQYGKRIGITENGNIELDI